MLLAGVTSIVLGSFFKFGSSWPVAGAQRCLSKWFTEKRHFLKGTAQTAHFKVWDMLDMLPEAFQR